MLSGFLGVVPSEYTSDEKRTQGQITKAGPPHARRLLVEAAHHYRHAPAVRLELKARQAGQDPRVVQVAWRCQRRLHERWTHLQGKRGKRTGTVAIACARELAAFCWEAPASAGALTSTHEGPPRGRSTGPRTRAMGNPRVSPAGWRPILDCEPGDEQGP